MRILLVIPTVFGGGAEQVAAVLSRQWSRAHTVSVLAWQAPGKAFDFGVPIDFADLGVQPGLWRKLRNVWRRVALIRARRREFQPDVVLAFMDEAGMPCVLAGDCGRLMVSVHHNPQWMPRWRRLLLGLFYRFPAAVIAVSEGVRGELAEALRLPPARLRHIPNPLALDAPYVVDAALEALGSGYLLAVGRLDVHTKGFDILLAAYAALPAGRPRLLILGEGEGRAFLEAEIQRLGLQGEVLLHGWVSDPRLFYQRAAALIVSSRYEGWSNVLMEAMGEACPVVATRCPYGPPEILGAELAQWLVAPGDVAALREGMQRVLALSADERAALAAAVRARVQRFGADQVAAQWIALAESLAKSLAAEAAR
ncbi:glycosyltransferase [Uliginosibacterium sediminicola]|uniref:Glycosyltransferase n=1 Tax=Uliginosibacterium sediminicola TaxID=2024550 RepID=A0ABU9Z486_9RHOO